LAPRTGGAVGGQDPSSGAEAIAWPEERGKATHSFDDDLAEI